MYPMFLDELNKNLNRMKSQDMSYLSDEYKSYIYDKRYEFFSYPKETFSYVTALSFV